MAKEEIKKQEELSDEQLDEVAGGMRLELSKIDVDIDVDVDDEHSSRIHFD